MKVVVASAGTGIGIPVPVNFAGVRFAAGEPVQLAFV